MEDPARPAEVLSFGPFELTPDVRLLTRNGTAVPLGARALDTLIALTIRAPEVVSKNDLLTKIWPDTTVDEGSLRFQVAVLRKSLDDGAHGIRYIATIAGRGYAFVAPVVMRLISSNQRAQAPLRLLQNNLPSRPLGMLGRSAEAVSLTAQLRMRRLVTLVGSGGVGKTTLAVSVGHDLASTFGDAVLFVDLGPISEPKLIAMTVASLAGLAVQSDDTMPALIAYLRDKRMLLILDTCEHLVEEVAAFAERIADAASTVHILATSRELLRARGEYVFSLEPLLYPPDNADGQPLALQDFPATALFLERAVAGGAASSLNEADAAIVAGICRKLDGVALAIELVAGRVASYGLQQIAVLLEQRFALLWPGQRTAPARHQTLQATLDWSYGLLSPDQRIVLRRLAIFRGNFTIDAVLEVAASPNFGEANVFIAVDSLVAKSIVAARPVGAMMRYRLLDTTRAYVLERENDDAELLEVARRHAIYYMNWLKQAGARWPTLSNVSERELHLVGLSNVRAALNWCFGPDGDEDVGTTLVTAATPVFLAMSLLSEAQRWSERGLAALGQGTTDKISEMRLQATLGVSLMFLQGGSPLARWALERSFEIAVDLGSAVDQMQISAPLTLFYLRFGDFNAALDCAKRCASIVETQEGSAAASLANSVSGISLHLSGELTQARAALEAALRPGLTENWTTAVYLGFEGKSLAGAILARTLWLQGYPEQACARARQTVDEAATMNHPLTFAIALIWAISVFLWNRDLQSAEEYQRQLVACAKAHSLEPYLLVARGFEGCLALGRGAVEQGITLLRDALQSLQNAPYKLLSTAFGIALADGLLAAGAAIEALEVVEGTIQVVETHGDRCYLPELFCLKARLLLIGPKADRNTAEACLRQALKQSRVQGARAWELISEAALSSLLEGSSRDDAAPKVNVAILTEERNVTGAE